MDQQEEPQLCSRASIQRFEMNCTDNRATAGHNLQLQRERNKGLSFHGDEDNEMKNVSQHFVRWKEDQLKEAEKMELLILESEQMRQHQYQNLLESQRVIDEVTYRREAEEKNISSLETKVHQTRLLCDTLNEQYRIVTNALNRMIILKEQCFSKVVSDSEMRNKLEEDINQLLATNAVDEFQEGEQRKNFDKNKNDLIQELERKRSDSRRVIEHLKSEIRIKDEKLESTNVKISSIQLRTEDSEDLDRIRQQTWQEKLVYLNESMNQGLQRKEEAEKILQSLETENSDMENFLRQKPKIETDLKSITERYQILEESNKELYEECQRIRVETKDKESTYEFDLREKLQRIQSLKDRESSASEELRSEKNKLNDQIKELESEINDSRNSARITQNRKDDIIKEISNVKEQIYQTTASVDSAKQRESVLIEEKKQMEEFAIYRRATLIETKETLKSKIEEQIGINSSLKNALQNMNMKLHDNEAERSLIKGRVKTAEDLLSMNELKQREIEEQISAFKQQLQVLETKISEQNQEISGNLAKIQDLENETESLSIQMASEEEDHKKQQSTLEEVLCTLKKKFIEYQGHLMNAQLINGNKVAEITRMKEEIDLLNTDLTNMEDVMQKLESELSVESKEKTEEEEATKANLLAAENRQRELKDTINELQVEVSDLRKKLMKEKSTIESISREINEANQDMEDLTKISQCNYVEMKEIFQTLVYSVKEQDTLLKDREKELRKLEAKIQKQGLELDRKRINVTECRSQGLAQKTRKEENTLRIQEAKNLVEEKEELIRNHNELKSKLEHLQTEKLKIKNEDRIEMEVLSNNFTSLRQICKDRFIELNTLSNTLNELKDKVADTLCSSTALKRENLQISQNITDSENMIKRTSLEYKLMQEKTAFIEARVKQTQSELNKFKKWTLSYSQQHLNFSLTSLQMKNSQQTENSLETISKAQQLSGLQSQLSHSPIHTPGSKEKNSISPNMPPPLTSTPVGSHTPVNITPRSILKANTALPTPQKSAKSVSFATDCETDHSIILESDDLKGLEEGSKNVQHLIEKHKEVQRSNNPTD